MSPHAVSRRKFLGYVGTALGGYAILRPNVASATSDLEGSDQQDAFAGVLDHVDAGTLYVADPTSGSLVAVVTNSATEVWREGEVDPTVFGPGDEIYALGHWDDSDFAAAYVTTLYRDVEAFVKSRNDGTLQTTKGTLELAPSAEPIEDPQVGLEARPISELSPGDHVFVAGRLDGATGNLVAVRIGVYVN
jgi:hypothetical protein